MGVAVVAVVVVVVVDVAVVVVVDFHIRLWISNGAPLKSFKDSKSNCKVFKII